MFFFFSIRNQLNILELKNISYYVILLVDRSWWTIQQIFDIFDINEIIQPIEPTEQISYINETSFFGLFVFAYVFFYIFLWNCTNKSDVHFKFHCSTIYYCSFFPQVNHIKENICTYQFTDISVTYKCKQRILLFDESLIIFLNNKIINFFFVKIEFFTWI